MSEALNEVFIDNFQKDPTLTWQYFGSSTGFFRLYPGVYVGECPSLSGKLYTLPEFQHILFCVGSVESTRAKLLDKHSAAQGQTMHVHSN